MATAAVAVVLVGVLARHWCARVERAQDDDVLAYEANDAATSNGLRLEFWRKSLGFLVQAPVGSSR